MAPSDPGPTETFRTRQDPSFGPGTSSKSKTKSLFIPTGVPETKTKGKDTFPTKISLYVKRHLVHKIEIFGFNVVAPNDQSLVE